MEAGLNHSLLKKKQSTSGNKFCPAVQRLARELGNLPDQVSPPSSSAPSICLPVSSTPVLNAAQIAASAKELVGEFDDVAPPQDIESVAESVETMGSSQQEPEYKQYFDNASLCMVGLFPSGNIQKSNMLPGGNGFAVATFPGSEQSISTEVPNSLHSRSPKNRPAAIRIRSPGWQLLVDLFAILQSCTTRSQNILGQLGRKIQANSFSKWLARTTAKKLCIPSFLKPGRSLWKGRIGQK